MEKIAFTDPETGESDSFYVLEEAVIQGNTYLLVTEEETGDSQAYILKQLSGDEDEEMAYEILEDDREIEAISKVFTELLDDTVIEQEGRENI